MSTNDKIESHTEKFEKPKGEKPEIPKRVYYSEQHDNFYDIISNRGMGVEFYATWFSRRKEFPNELKIKESKLRKHPLSFQELRQINGERCDDWHNGTKWSNGDWFLALVGELGEAANIIKKLNRIRDGLNTQEHDENKLRAELSKEFADVMIYLDLFARENNVDLDTAVINKFNEVSDRFGFEYKLAPNNCDCLRLGEYVNQCDECPR